MTDITHGKLHRVSGDVVDPNYTANWYQHESGNDTHQDDYISVDNVVYIIMVDGKPKCYEFEYINAKNKMLEYANDLINNNSDTYKCYMTETSNKEIIISGVRKFFIISYESVLHTVGLCDISLT
jgi:hypothetical protein